MGISNYLANSLLKHIVGEAEEEYESPSSLWVGLGTSDPDPSDQTSWSAELSGKGYERAKIEFGSPDQKDSEDAMIISNTNYVNFPRATDDWGSFYSYAIWDDKDNGNILISGGLSAPPAILEGQYYRLLRGEIEIEIPGGSFYGVSKYLATKLLDHVFGGNAFSQPSFHIAAMEDEPAWDETGSELDEPTEGGYQRQNVSSWNPPSSLAITNDGQVDFDAATGSGWNKDIGYAAYCDAQSGGNMLGFSAVGGSPPYTVANGDVAFFADEAILSTF